MIETRKATNIAQYTLIVLAVFCNCSPLIYLNSLSVTYQSEIKDGACEDLIKEGRRMGRFCVGITKKAQLNRLVLFV